MKKNIKGLYIFIIIFLIWWVGSLLNLFNSYIIPSPLKVIRASIKLLVNGKLFIHIGISLKRVFIGFFIASCLALPFGIILGLKKNIYDYFKSILNFFRHIPPLSLIPMIILWFGIGELSKIVIIILAAFFPIFLNTLKGITSCDKKFIEVGKVFSLSSKEIFCKIIFPNAIPEILMGLKLGIGYSWRAIIAAELIAASSGIGYLINDAQQISRSDIVLVGILSIGIIGVITDKLFSKFIQKFSSRRKADYEKWI